MNGPNIATPLIPEHFTFRRSAEGDDTRGLGSKEAGVGDDALNKFVVDIYICATAFSSCLETARGIETGLKSGLNVAVLSRLLVACQRIYSITTKKFEDF